MNIPFLRRLFGSRNDRLIRKYSQRIESINVQENEISALSDEELRHKTLAFNERFNKGETLDALLPEAFAVVREASKRVLGMRHFDVQLIGGMVLHDGKISEMRTGEGKTLVATLPVYLNALTGKGVHVVTVNDYLAKRDAEWMGTLYQFLGLTIGVNLPNIPHTEKKEAYLADITYGTNNEFGFDYLRDNMAYSVEERVQRGLNYAIVDEVDSILIDEARTPLIISGQSDEKIEHYVDLNKIAQSLRKQDSEQSEGDYWVDEKTQQVVLSESGHEQAEEMLSEAGLLGKEASLYDTKSIGLIHHLYSALRANALFHRDQHYVVKDQQVIIVDEFTGRMMAGRRWSDGLHQAVEAKEGVAIQQENQTLASITFQNYFRLYQKLAGMTGTADTEAFEFNQIYGLETVVIPTHNKVCRVDHMDKVYCSTKAKYQAIVEDIKACHSRLQPVLVGTTSIENSELLSQLLEKEKLPHQVLNAKHHEKESYIIAQAGRSAMITIATNMAGRGTDIVLGGNPEPEILQIKGREDLSEEQKTTLIEELRAKWRAQHDDVLKAGGLHIVGTERHESRRIDNQLRGRAGRQGDVGSSRFYLSLEDPLLRIFASDRVAQIMSKLNIPDNEAIEHVWVDRAIENAQRKVESRNFDIRKQLLEYDDVMNDQRKVIYEQRNFLLENGAIDETLRIFREEVLDEVILRYIPANSLEENWDIAGLERLLAEQFDVTIPLVELLKANPEWHEETLYQLIKTTAHETYQKKEGIAGKETMQKFGQSILLQFLDHYWREHLVNLDYLRQGIYLRSYAQKNPKQEYKRESFELFQHLLLMVKQEVTKTTLCVHLKNMADLEEEVVLDPLKDLHAEHPSIEQTALLEEELPSETIKKMGRNELCPCGSEKKYKHCHGKLA